jgi:hypothetical protein
MALTKERLREIVNELVGRPGHEKVRTLVYQLLVDGLGASSSDVQFERPLPEVHGRLDALLGRTVFEFKRNLSAEVADAEEELSRYLGEREAATRTRFVGIATDGTEFVPYELEDGHLVRVGPPFRPSVEKADALLGWLSSVVAVRPELEPEPEVVRGEFGKDSLAFNVARSRLAALWQEVKDRPDVELKRQLWADLLRLV